MNSATVHQLTEQTHKHKQSERATRKSNKYFHSTKSKFTSQNEGFNLTAKAFRSNSSTLWNDNNNKQKLHEDFVRKKNDSSNILEMLPKLPTIQKWVHQTFQNVARWQHWHTNKRLHSHTHMTIWEHKTSDPNENNRNLLLRPKLCAQQMQMKKSYKMKMKTYQISQNGATDSTKCMMLSFSLGINKQTNIMMKNDAQMRNQPVNHFSIIQTSNTHRKRRIG